MIKNCFNYVGSKDRIFSLIDANLDKSKQIFVDVFCGSGVVGVNEIDNFNKIILNDACWQVIETLKFFRDSKYDTIIEGMDSIIKRFGLSKENKEGYLKLRDFYNETSSTIETFDPFLFYCLVTHSFNYNIHINSSGGFSVPFGAHRSNFNESLRSKFRLFQGVLHGNKDKITIKSLDFKDLFKKSTKLINKTIFYVDPPYLSSDSSYGRIHYLGKWDAVKEKNLYNCLDYIDKAGGSFLLSNVLENNGKINEVLIEWSQKYNVIEVGTDFTNCNHQRKNLGKTKEVLIRNY